MNPGLVQPTVLGETCQGVFTPNFLSLKNIFILCFWVCRQVQVSLLVMPKSFFTLSFSLYSRVQTCRNILPVYCKMFAPVLVSCTEGLDVKAYLVLQMLNLILN